MKPGLQPTNSVLVVFIRFSRFRLRTMLNRARLSLVVSGECWHSEQGLQRNDYLDEQLSITGPTTWNS